MLQLNTNLALIYTSTSTNKGKIGMYKHWTALYWNGGLDNYMLYLSRSVQVAALLLYTFTIVTIHEPAGYIVVYE